MLIIGKGRRTIKWNKGEEKQGGEKWQQGEEKEKY